jgi:hypothetical protein
MIVLVYFWGKWQKSETYSCLDIRLIHLFLLAQNMHLAPSTQQAEQAGFTRAKNHKTCQSIFPEN